MTTQHTIDQAKADAFVGKVLGDTAALAVTASASSKTWPSRGQPPVKN